MTAKTRRLLEVLLVSAGSGLLGVAVMIYLTWPANTLGNYLYDRRNHEATVRILTLGIAREGNPFLRRFYQAMLAEEKGDFAGAIQGFRALRDEAQPGTPPHLHSALRLGLAYGLNGQPELELATYQALMDRYPVQSRIGQAAFYLRRGERDRARALLDEALALDGRAGSLESDRSFARRLRSGLGPPDRGANPAPR